jgi:hypothetical protein
LFPKCYGRNYQVIELAIALLMAVVALEQNRQKGQVVAILNPNEDIVTTPPTSVPARSWKMDEVSKKWLLCRSFSGRAGITAPAGPGAEAQQKRTSSRSRPGITTSSTG